jgi:hypothetical protein
VLLVIDLVSMVQLPNFIYPVHTSVPAGGVVLLELVVDSFVLGGRHLELILLIGSCIGSVLLA